MQSRMGFLESLSEKPNYFKEIEPQDKLTLQSSYEPKFKTVPPKPYHPIVKACFFVSLLLLLVALCPLNYKHHLLIDLCIVFFIFTMYYIDFVQFTIISVLVTLLFLAISITIEVIWYKIYTSNWQNSVYIDDGSLVDFRRY